MTDTNDRKLMKLAAKAAELQIVGDVDSMIVQPERWAGGYIIRNDQGGDSAWNPLADDGDALRLAVKLGLRIHPDNFSDFPKATAFRPTLLDPFWAFSQEASGHDPYAATRRAIVRAAAAVAA